MHFFCHLFSNLANLVSKQLPVLRFWSRISHIFSLNKAFFNLFWCYSFMILGNQLPPANMMKYHLWWIVLGCLGYGHHILWTPATDNRYIQKLEIYSNNFIWKYLNISLPPLFYRVRHHSSEQFGRKLLTMTEPEK